MTFSDDGTVVAIGSNGNDRNAKNTGRVHLFRFSDGDWDSLGSKIDGEAADDLFGRTVALSVDGTLVEIGAHRNDGNGKDSGHVRDYRLQNDAWQQVGMDIDDADELDRSGIFLAPSANGTAVAIRVLAKTRDMYTRIRVMYVSTTRTLVSGTNSGRASRANVRE